MRRFFFSLLSKMIFLVYNIKIKGVSIMALEKKSIGSRIKNIRINLDDNKTSMNDFGKLLDPIADRSLVARWENGVNLPNQHRLEQIAKIGGVSLDYLLSGKELNGHGKRIEHIRSEYDMTPEEFGYFFKPAVSARTVESWENENALPNLKQLKKISELGNMNYLELLFNEKRKRKTIYDVYTNLDVVEKSLAKKNISSKQAISSDLYFTNMNNLRLTQSEAPESFELLVKVSDELMNISNKNIVVDYDDLNEKKEILVELIEQFCDLHYEETRT